MFGGALGTVSDCSSTEGCSDELLKLDAHEQQWTEITINGPRPLARFGHTMVSVEYTHSLFVFGGATHLGLAKDLWTLDTVSMEWTLLDHDLPTCEPRPNARERHCMASVGASRSSCTEAADDDSVGVHL